MQADIASVDPLRCSHIALANYLYVRYEQQEAKFPDPRDRDEW